MLAIVAPGQGAQTPGFLAPWLAQPTYESKLVEWHTPAEVRNLRAPDKPHAKPRIGGAARTLLERPDFDQLVEKARAEAREAAG